MTKNFQIMPFLENLKFYSMILHVMRRNHMSNTLILFQDLKSPDGTTCPNISI